MTGQCPHCGRPYKVAERTIGRSARCDQCGQVFTVTPPPPQPDPVTGATDTSWPEDPVPVEAIEPAPVYTRQRSAPPEAKITAADVKVVAAKHHKILIGGAIGGFIVSFVTGLALGLNIHPPDQHELETGLEAGRKLGFAAGFESGRQDGYDSGVGQGQALAANAARDAAKAEYDPIVRRATSQFNRLRQSVDRIKSDHKAAEIMAHDTGYATGHKAGVAEEAVRKAAALVERQDVYIEAIAAARDEEYKRGLHEAGYERWRDEGYAAGVIKGRSDAEFDIENKLTEARRAGRDDGIEEGRTIGHKEGVRDGKAQGRRLGYKEGERAGYDRGYKVGYADGYRRAGGK